MMYSQLRSHVFNSIERYAGITTRRFARHTMWRGVRCPKKALHMGNPCNPPQVSRTSSCTAPHEPRMKATHDRPPMLCDIDSRMPYLQHYHYAGAGEHAQRDNALQDAANFEL